MADGAKKNIEITSKAMMYDNPEPLDYKTHGALGMKRLDQAFGFVKEHHFVPVTANEFGVAATTYPIIFAGEQRQPLAVMGLGPKQNLFVNDEGAFKQDSYIPGYVRRYPFVLAVPGDNDRMIVCIDRDFEGISDKPDIPFFKGENEPSEYTQNSIEFLKEYERQRLGTEQMMKRLNELDLFENKEVHFDPRRRGMQGEPQKVTEYTAISEPKLNALDEKTLKELASNGILGAIYAHLISLFNWDRLLDEAMRRQSAGQAPSGEMPKDAPAANAPKTKGKGVKA